MAASQGPPRLPAFPTDDKDAEERFELYRRRDPFPDIPPALLNSADLLDYVATVGMLSPYKITEEDREDWLKPASCAVACTGDVLRFGFDKQIQKVTKTADYTLQEGKRLDLPANSITFISVRCCSASRAAASIRLDASSRGNGSALPVFTACFTAAYFTHGRFLASSRCS